MAIQDEMYKQIVAEITETVSAGKQKIIVNNDNALQVAKMLTELAATEQAEAESLVNQYIANIKNICNSK